MSDSGHLQEEAGCQTWWRTGVSLLHLDVVCCFLDQLRHVSGTLTAGLAGKWVEKCHVSIPELLRLMSKLSLLTARGSSPALRAGGGLGDMQLVEDLAYLQGRCYINTGYYYSISLCS